MTAPGSAARRSVPIAATGVAPPAALQKGVRVFLLPAAIMIVLAAGLLPGAWALAHRVGER